MYSIEICVYFSSFRKIGQRLGIAIVLLCFSYVQKSNMCDECNQVKSFLFLHFKWFYAIYLCRHIVHLQVMNKRQKNKNVNIVEGNLLCIVPSNCLIFVILNDAHM